MALFPIAGNAGFGGFGARQTIRLEGLIGCAQTLKRLGPRIAFDVAVKATRAGAAPMVKAGKRLAPRRKGHLKKAVTQKLKRYRRQHKVLSIIGPREFKQPDGENPAKYAHLVENDTAPHVIPGPVAYDVPFVDGEGKRIVRQAVNHPGTKGTKFLQRAVDTAQGQSLQKFTEKFKTETQAAALAERRS